MRTVFYSEADGWNPDGAKIDTAENLEAVRRTLEEVGPVILEHRHYRGSSAPDRLVFDEFDDLLAYLSERAVAGDSIWVWSYAELCRDDNPLVHGKCPDQRGMVPERGAY